MNDPEIKNESWERNVLENLASASLREQRRARGWGIFFKSLTFLYLFILLFVALGWVGDGKVRLNDKHTALVDLRGIIMADSVSIKSMLVFNLHFRIKIPKGSSCG